MELKLPPIIVCSIFTGLMYLLAEFLPFGQFDFFGRNGMTLFLIVVAFFMAVWAVWSFWRAGTTIDPGVPSRTSDLVVSGVYRFTRNPMYLSMLILLLAWGLWLGNAFNVLLASGFVGYMNRFQIGPEERELSRIFGKRYGNYCLKVRRWF